MTWIRFSQMLKPPMVSNPNVTNAVAMNLRERNFSPMMFQKIGYGL